MTEPAAAPVAFRCSDGALERGDAKYATAAPAERLLLIEQAGPWGRDAVRESRLDPAVVDNVLTRATAAHARVLLIRRVGRRRVGPRAWAVVDTRAGRSRSWWGAFSADEELLDLPLDGSAGQPSDEPAYLVCTHGRHDVCCAIRGRPVAAALAAHRPQQTWECSHVGGDRFAANLVVVPYGLYYGHVTPVDVAELVRDTEAGLVQPRLLRGRTSLSGPEQAAQHHVRLALDERRIEALSPVETEALGAQRWRVRISVEESAGEAGAVEVVVHAEATRIPARLTCAGVGAGTVRTYALESITEVGRQA